MPTLKKKDLYRLFAALIVAGILIEDIDWPWMRETFGPAPMWIVVGLLAAIAIGAIMALILSAIAARMQ